MANLKIFLFLLGDSSPSDDTFPIVASLGLSVAEVKDEVYAKKQNGLKGIDATDLILWKLNVPIPAERIDAEVAALGEDLDLSVVNEKISAVAVEMFPTTNLSDHFPVAPLANSLHVIVQAPNLPSAGRKRGPPNHDTRGEPASKRTKQHSGFTSLAIHPEWSRRQDTVSSISELLHKYRLVQVRGTQASGKTTLMHLLHAHIIEKVPDAQVFIEKTWPKGSMKEDEERIAEKFPGYPYFTNGKWYLLFDSAQTTYWDWHLWWAFKKIIQGYGETASVYAILFCRYGIEDITDLGHHAPISFGRGTVTLERADKGLSKPCGLLLDKGEFLDVIRCRQNLHLSRDLCDFIYSFTRGHVGAAVAVLDILLMKQRPSMLKGVTYTLEQFHQDTTSFDELCKQLSVDREIGRGMPQNPAEYAQAMKALLLDGSIHSGNEKIARDIRQMLSKGYLHGFVNLDEDNCYTFPSPLHQQLWSWHLLPETDYQLPYYDLVSFVKATVSRFTPSQLDQSDGRVGSASHRPPDAQYQEECYRCVHNLTEGNVRISPEYAAAAGSRPGRIDFFIPSKKWGIELTRDGRKLDEHATRFANGGAYEQWLQSSNMADYVLLDFCSTRPVQSHPGIRGLYHIVFSKDDTGVEIYNNRLELL